MEVAIAFTAVLLLIVLISNKRFNFLFKFAGKLILNCFLGALLLLLINFFGASYQLSLGINAVTILVAGFCGIPGVIFLEIFKFYF
ncbi:pro-sigmaK processing inhibitor BofA family protein [Clostridium sp. 19966]|uniref:pro-sigmaK processing inhibitor BofA family protein n=1 Tax=Clostridium sp. 19966 TaxID=2768166 RepID=UPI0028DF6619|nr:pro-sigmaK processing inhibitor BofA family protein [Clostridium sp. 19966]MDT8719559.1 pro-sigmaK processing inhibitor BofA family protein [Clostridium sp. 19966]